MSLHRRNNRNNKEHWESRPATGYARTSALERLLLGRISLIAGALAIAYLLLSGAFSPGQVSPGTAYAEQTSLYQSAVCDAPYQAILLSPAVPGWSDTYTYVVDRCRSSDEAAEAIYDSEQVDYLKLSGCWRTEEIKGVRASAGHAGLFAPDYVSIRDVTSADLPITVDVTFYDSLASGESRTWVWAHVGPAIGDGYTSVVGGPFCSGTTGTPSPVPAAPPATPATPAPPATPATPATPAAPVAPAAPAASATTPQVADLMIVKTDSPDPVKTGGTLAYIVTVANIGQVTAENVIVTEFPPDQATLISSTPDQGSCTGTMCTLGSLDPGKAATISYVARVDDGAESPLTNSVCVATTTEETDLANNCTEEDTTISTPQEATSTPDNSPAGATPTPDDLPTGGGEPSSGGSGGLPVLLLIGAGFVIAGGVSGLILRRRASKN